uniref:Reverse transcriptase n=1 Tax=Bactrocera tryoni TaxID=59916 RepID=A0A142LX39_BACRY|nr:hypothetical protein [Bactrocera tryoni]
MAVNTEIAQVNLHHAAAASAVIASRFTADKLGILLIQEPWVHRGEVKGLKTESNKVIWDLSSERPRTCIVVRNNIEFFCISEFLTQDLVAVQARDFEGKDFVLASAYFPGEASTAPPEVVERLVEHCRRHRLPLIIGCDANAHHLEWGSTNCNARGESLLEYILGNSLAIENVGCEPTFITISRREVLDITLSNEPANGLVSQWRVSTEPSLSDHRIVRFTLKVEVRQLPPRRNPRKANWDTFREILSEELSRGGQTDNSVSGPGIESRLSELNGSVINAYHGSCPLKVPTDRRNCPWWSRKLADLRKKVRSLFNKAKRTGVWEEYRSYLTLYNKEIRSAKQASFRRFCENVTSTPEAARLHKALARGTTDAVLAIKRGDGTFTTSAEDRATELLRAHFPETIREDQCLPVIEHRPSREDWSIAKQLFTADSIRWAMASFERFKSPGVDGIFPALLQQGEQFLLPHLVRLLRESLAMAYIPEVWRTAKVIFIPKVGRKDYSLAKSFRPISLTSFLLKTMEKIVDHEIRSKALKSAPLHAAQHAYRAGRSTNTALYQLTSEIESSLENGEVMLCAFLDIEGAFDNTSHRSVARALEKRNVAAPVRRWIEAVLRTRIAETTVGDKRIRLGTTRGCPQGGVLSPLLWSLVVDDLLALLTDNGIRCQGYADDIVIIARGKYEDTLCDLIQRGLNLAKGWCREVELNINPSKTTVVPFTRRRSLPGLRNLTLGGREIEMTNKVKYLGLTLDSTLRWKQHVNLTLVKATKALMVCNRLAGKSWGCKPRIVRWLYTMIVRPIITYGAVAWASIASQTSVGIKLSKLQRLACVCMTGAMRTCPTAALEVLLELTPLHLVIGQVAKHTLLQITAEGCGKGKVISSQRMEKISGNIPLALLPRDSTTKTVNFTKKFKVTLGSKDEWNDSTLELMLRNSTLRWYTDGSKTSEGIGAGIAGPRTKLSIPMGSFPSIFQAEVFAISRCIEINLHRNYRNERITILSDSQAALKAISSYEIKSLLVQECRERLNSLAERNQVHLIWVPGHKGIAGNELADELARSAASTNMVGPEPFIAVGPHTIKELLRKEEGVGRERYWQQLQGMRHAKLLMGGYNLSRFKYVINLPRDKLKLLVAFYTGHCKLNKHLYNMGLSSCANCRFCDREPETPEHLLIDCTAVCRRRIKALGSMFPNRDHIASLAPSSILDFINMLGLSESL